MSVSYTNNHPKIAADTVRNANLFLRMVVDEIDKEAFYKTPKDQGELRKNLRKRVLGLKGEIVWRSKYAVAQERGYTTGPVRRYTTPGTGPHFAENAVRKVVGRSDAIARKARLI